jgi:orotidine-5'-phosphate decarboxylase
MEAAKILEQEHLTAAQRLIVAADFQIDPSVKTRLKHPDPAPIIRLPADPQSPFANIHRQVLGLCEALSGTSVCIKMNSALRLLGYPIIETVQGWGFGVMADLKLNDIGATLATDGAFLKYYAPEIVTAMCTAGPDALNKLQDALPDTRIVGVTVLTSLTEGDAHGIYDANITEAVLRMVDLVIGKTPIRSFVCSPKEASVLRTLGSNLHLITPAIRPAWSIVSGDDQNPDRIATPASAIKSGASQIVIGRPIMRAKSPREAAERTIAEIAAAL